MFKPSEIVTVTMPDGATYTARLIREETNGDGAPNGIALVEVTGGGSARRTVGKRYHVGMCTLALAPSDAPGNRIQIPAHADEWMRGDRYGVIREVRTVKGVPTYTVKLDR